MTSVTFEGDVKMDRSDGERTVVGLDGAIESLFSGKGFHDQSLGRRVRVTVEVVEDRSPEWKPAG